MSNDIVFDLIDEAIKAEGGFGAIWRNQNGPRPQGLYATVFAGGSKPDFFDQVDDSDESINVGLASKYDVDIWRFADIGIATRIQRAFRIEANKIRLFQSGVAINDFGEVNDTSSLRDVHIEAHCNFSLSVSIMDSFIDIKQSVKTIEMSGEISLLLTENVTVTTP